MLELYQAEWCPHSSKVRQRLTELGVDFVARQVAAEPEERDAVDDIPVLVREDGTRLEGEDDILAWLDERYEPREDSDDHRSKALDKAGLAE